LDEFIVMPNHFHAIVIIRDYSGNDDGIIDSCRGDRPVAPTKPMGPKPKSIGSLIAGYKSSATKKINQLRGKSGVPVWQRNYFEHIIRDDKSLVKIRQYILDNPGNWCKDDFYR
jgi:putative transposase